jgi:hypothetical protein
MTRTLLDNRNSLERGIPVSKSIRSATNLPEQSLTELRRKKIFSALVAAQDSGVLVADSRIAMEALFCVSEQQLREVENEGIENDWPPL